VPPIDPNTLPQDVQVLQKIVLDLCEQLRHESAEKDKYQSLLRELLEAQRNRKSEQLSKEQLDLFETLWKAVGHSEEDKPDAAEDDDIDQDPQDVPKSEGKPSPRRRGRQPLGRHLKRERIVHDLAEAEKHCACCGKDLRLIAEETSERYEYLPASLKVIQDVCLKYACDCTVKTGAKPPQPIEKSTAGRQFIGASDSLEVRRSSAATSAGTDVPTPWRGDLA
jgi:transposase